MSDLAILCLYKIADRSEDEKPKKAFMPMTTLDVPKVAFHCCAYSRKQS